MKLTIIGAGNMGGATALGLAKSGKIAAKDVTVTALHQTTLDKFADKGFVTGLDNKTAVAGADIVMIAVKPWFVKQVVEEIKPFLDYGRQIVVNVAAGLKPEELLSWFDKDGSLPQLVNVIPNTAIEILQSMSFIWPVNADDESVRIVSDLFGAAGTAMVVMNERQLNAGMALASCGIAYAMRYIRASAEGGVELGMYPKDAIVTACQTVIGAASLIMEHGSHPESEIDKVTTPGGITIKGLNEMEHAGFTSAVIRGLKASKA